jgi:hypothetical protein
MILFYGLDQKVRYRFLVGLFLYENMYKYLNLKKQG